MSDTQSRLPSALVLKYYTYKATVTFGFFWPIFTLFLLQRNLSYTQIGVLGTISAAVTVVGEIPTGYIADRIGRRTNLVIGSILLTLSVFGFIVAKSFFAFGVLYLLWALGLAFQSGSGDAWLYETLKERLREEEFTRIRGRGGSVSQWVSAGSMLVSGGLYSFDPRLPFLIGGLVISISIPITLSFPRNNLGNVDDDSLTVLQTMATVREALFQPPLRSFVLYMAVFFGIIQSADKFIQPIAIRTLGLPEAGLGPLYAAFSIVAGVSSFHADKIENAITTRWTFVFIPSLIGLFFLLPFAFSLAAFPMFFVMKAGKEAMTPITSGYLNDNAESIGRATLLSAVAMTYAFVQMVLKPLSGLVADKTTPITAVAVLGAFFFVCATAVYVLRVLGESTHSIRVDKTD